WAATPASGGSSAPGTTSSGGSSTCSGPTMRWTHRARPLLELGGGTKFRRTCTHGEKLAKFSPWAHVGCTSLRYLSSADVRPRSRRATTSCWICWVPSKMSRILESRPHFSSSDSSEYPAVPANSTLLRVTSLAIRPALALLIDASLELGILLPACHAARSASR